MICYLFNHGLHGVARSFHGFKFCNLRTRAHGSWRGFGCAKLAEAGADLQSGPCGPLGCNPCPVVRSVAIGAFGLPLGCNPCLVIGSVAINSISKPSRHRLQIGASIGMLISPAPCALRPAPLMQLHSDKMHELFAGVVLLKKDPRKG